MNIMRPMTCEVKNKRLEGEMGVVYYRIRNTGTSREVDRISVIYVQKRYF